MKKIYFKSSVLIVVFFMLINNSLYSQTIYSTNAGGPWDSTWTWVGGNVPFSYNDVVLNGPVYTSGATCHSLTINTSGTLYNNYYNYTLTVNGDVVNNGAISNNANSLTVNVDGDIINNGTWNNHMTYLTGSGYHHITCQNNKPISCYQFQNIGTGTMFIDTEAYFDNVRVYLGGFDLTIAANAFLKLHHGFLYDGTVIGFGSPSVITGLGALGAESPYFQDISFTDLKFTGNIEINNNCSTHGTVVNDGFMQNDYYSYTLNIYDNFTNNGTIQSYANFFNLNVYGNFINNGPLTNNEIALCSDADQDITELNGHTINTSYFTSYKPSGKTLFITDVDFLNCNVNMQNDTLIVPDNGTLTFVGSQFRNTVVYATPAMTGRVKLNMNETSHIEKCHVFNPEILNKVKARDNSLNNSFYGDILVTDTLENDFYSSSVAIHGNIVNNGVIQSFANSFYLEIDGNIVNNGQWTNYYTTLTGTTDQHLSCLNGHTFAGFRFYNNNTSGDIYVDNLVHFDNSQIYFNNTNLQLPANSTLKIHAAYLYQCNIIGSGSSSVVYGDLGTNSDSPYYQNVAFNDVSLEGENDINGYCSTHGNVVNTGTLKNDYYNYHLQVYDDFTNNGIIQNYANSFYIDLYGNFTNNGTLNIYEFGLFSSSDQMLSELNANTYLVNYFTSYKPSGNTIMLTDVDFAGCGFNMNNDTLIIPDNGTLKFVGSTFKNTVVYASPFMTGNFMLDMDESSYILGCTVYNPELIGTVKINSGNNFYGNIIVTDTLENDYYSYTLGVYGDMVNNGTVQNFVSSFSLDLYGDFINNGILTNSYFNLKSTADQTLSELNGNSYRSANFSSAKPSGKTIFNTDVDFIGCNFNMDNDTLIMPDNGILKFDACSFNNTVVYASPSMTGNLKLDMNETSYMYNCQVFNPEIRGVVKVDDYNTFYGNILVSGTLWNNFYNHTLDILGSVVNNGTIQNFANALSLNIDGDIQNNGVWNNSYTYLNGSSEQHILLQNSHYITGQMRFVSDIQTDPYQWYWDGWAIINPPYPDPAIFSGETSGTLVFLNPVNQDRLGTYYCNTGGGNSRNIIVDECFGIEEFTPLNLDFGTQEIAAGQETLSSWFKNTGDCSLLRDSLFLYGLQAPFSNASSVMSGLILEPGDSIEIPVYLNKDFPAGTYTDTLFISNYNNTNSNLTSGLIAYYPFNGNANDESSNANDGTVMNGASLTTDRFGNPNSAYYLDGADDYIEIADSPSLRPTNLTITGWFNFSSFQSVTSLIGKTVGSSWQDSYTIWRQSYMKAATGADGQFDEIAFAHSTALNQWYQISYTYDDAANTHSLYIDGQLVKTEENTVTIGYDTHPLLIGADIENESLAYYFNGFIDDIRIYDRALSSAEIHDLYYENSENPDIAQVVVQAELIQPPRELALKAFLEGPFNGTDMNTDLNNMLPADQPYNVLPWQYNGGEAVASIPNANVVDWVLVEYRDAADAASANSSTSIGGQAAFLLSDGSIVDLDGSSNLSFNYTLSQNLFIVIWHRNHLPILSKYALNESAGVFSYDFTTAASQAFGDMQNDLGGGVFGMIAGDANADGIINELDGVESWYLQVGQAGYLSADVNLNGQVNNQDKNDVWLPNFGKTVNIP